MNANELADFIETGGENINRKELATMLRKQAKEIEALKILVDELAGYKASYENGIRMEDGYGLN